MKSLTDHVISFELQDFILESGFLNDDAVFVLVNGSVYKGERRIQIHEGSIQVAQFHEKSLIMGSDDGKITRFDHSDTITSLVSEQQQASKQWVNALACHHNGSIAWSCGKAVYVRDAKGDVKMLPLRSSCQGLAFRPKGYGLAIAQNGGALLWMPNTQSQPDWFEWKGSHLDIIWSPDGRYLITSMQENQLHGWQISEKKHIRMSGYPAKPRSFSWSKDGNWFATSGAEAAILWPFVGKEGPSGKAPRECGVRPKKVTKVAFHPSALVLAVGYEDGFIMLVRLTDAAELLVRGESDYAPVTALTWHKNGTHLAFGTQNGHAGLLTLPS